MLMVKRLFYWQAKTQRAHLKIYSIPQYSFIYVVKEDIKSVGVREDDAKDRVT